ncbi:DUF4439 domain-containing protein [Jatrophihabitans sp. YIM 134969]
MTTPTPPPSSPPPSTTPSDSQLVGAAQDALAAERQAVWGYPVLGPRLTDRTQVALARTCDDAHGALVDALTATLVGLARTPVAPAVDYPLPSPLTTPAQAAAYALQLEEACLAAWRYVVVRTGDGTDVGGLKTRAVDALVAGAVRAARWRALATPATPTVAFPGT